MTDELQPGTENGLQINSNKNPRTPVLLVQTKTHNNQQQQTKYRLVGKRPKTRHEHTSLE